jgi:hypothetical protein
MTPTRFAAPLALAIGAAAVAVGLAAPASANPVLHQACSDLNKLAYIPGVGQVVCGDGEWVRSVQPTGGIRPLGASCTPQEMQSVYASTPDGHLIWCPSRSGVWKIYHP